MVWDSISKAFDNNLITQEEVRILWSYKKDWYDLYALQWGLPTEEEELEALEVVEEYKPLKVRYKYNKSKENK